LQKTRQKIVSKHSKKGEKMDTMTYCLFRERSLKILELEKKGFTEQQAEEMVDGLNKDDSKDDREIEDAANFIVGLLVLIALVVFVIIKL
jgi:hypothetical protein